MSIKTAVTRSMRRYATSYLAKAISDTKRGKNPWLNKRYANSTRLRRQRLGLYTKSINLYGSSRYSGKSWRLLDTYKITNKGDSLAITTNQSLLSNLLQARYGNFLAPRAGWPRSK